MAAPDTPAIPPFVLLDDARGAGDHSEAGGARLYQNPRETIVARRAEEVGPALDRLTALQAQGHWLAGMVAYEAGLALEPRLAHRAACRTGADGPLLWFGAFAQCHRLASSEVAAWLAAHAREAGPARLGPMLPTRSPGGYAGLFAKVQGAIAAGDTYQVNATFPLTGRWRGDPLALYTALREAGGGGHGAVVFDGQAWLLSVSPELFFELRDGAITARPMKGTRPRGATPERDAALAAELAASTKDRAENLMILDLTRNDLARVAAPGSVQVENPFAIESYPSVHTMTSTVRARLATGLTAVDILRAIFPCGSITGAPKIRAMELIDEREAAPRGAYCGAIGHIDPVQNGKSVGDAAFNVAIRTLRLSPDDAGSGAGRAVLGVGGAVVADSRMIDEWRECLVKGGFVVRSGVAAFDLIEAMRFEPETGITLIELHLERIKASAAELGFSFDRHQARNQIQALCFDLSAPAKLRLLLARDGAIALEAVPLSVGEPVLPITCAVLPLPVDPGDLRLRHKTSDRSFYEAAHRVAAGAGAGEALLIRDDGLLTEATRANIFVERAGLLLTPPARLGLLPGVLRRQLIEEGRAVEGDLTLADLADGFLLGNAVRGLLPARLLD